MSATPTTESSVLAGLATFPASEHLSVGKDGFNEFFNFNYATEPALFAAARAALAEAGLSATISFEQATHELIPTFDRDGNERPQILATVAARLTIRDTAGLAVDCVAYGMGLDPGDKAMSKAETQASKVVVQKALMIAIESDDTDAGHAGSVANRASGGQRQSYGDGAGTASEKQLGYLCSLVKAVHVVPKNSTAQVTEAMALRLARMQGDPADMFAKVSKRTASDLIEKLKQTQDKVQDPDQAGAVILERLAAWEAEHEPEGGTVTAPVEPFGDVPAAGQPDEPVAATADDDDSVPF